MLDGGLMELLQARYQGERHRDALERSGAKQEQSLGVGDGQPFLPDVRAGLLGRSRQHAGALSDADHVQDEGHLSVSHDGGAGVGGESFQLLAQRFDDDLLRVADAVHHQAELPVLALKNHDADRFRTARPVEA